MKRALVSVLFPMAIAACSPSAEQPPANTAEPAQAKPEAAPVPSLVGEWSIATIDARPPEQVWPMIARITPGRLTIVSECRRMTWNFRQDRNIVQLTPHPGSGTDCPRPRSPAEQQAEKTVGLANIAMFSNEGREVELTGPGGRVTMTRR